MDILNTEKNESVVPRSVDLHNPEEVRKMVENGLEVVFFCWHGRARSQIDATRFSKMFGTGYIEDGIQKMVDDIVQVGGWTNAKVSSLVEKAEEARNKYWGEVDEALGLLPIIVDETTDDSSIGTKGAVVVDHIRRVALDHGHRFVPIDKFGAVMQEILSSKK